MGIGVGIFLIVIGLILLLDVIEDFPDAIADVIDVETLGWICLIVGILGIVLALVMNRQRSRTTHIQERRDI
ncbi:DUF6458 family protein [Nocardioides sp.]|uniref:DUF6458 family protein n=1 Tax=Nocardioides sp. TaxID=35761 RepID=UPI002D8039F4|nr:DUF6458 family protein [Nocardioides sp.]HET8962006.1 DUF6458 family protein [Nocardioides sp.]